MRTLLFLAGGLLTASLCRADVIYTLDILFPVSGEHVVSWTLPDFLSTAGMFVPVAAITTSEGPLVDEGGGRGLLVGQHDVAELRVFFNIFTSSNHRMHSSGPTLELPGLAFPVSPGMTGTFIPTVGGSSHCGPPDSLDGGCDVSERSSSVTLTIGLGQPVPEPSTAATLCLGILIAVSVRMARAFRYS